MDACHHPVELLEQVLLVVERAVGEDVHLRPGEQPEAALGGAVVVGDLLDPLAQLIGGDVVAEPVARRVVGHRQVGVAALARRLGHLLERVAPVRERRVAVQVAAQVADLDQLRQLAGRRRGDLAAALAQLGLDVVEPEPRVDLLLGRVARDLARLGLEDAVLRDRQPLLDCPLAQLDVVLGRAGEVLKQVAVGVRARRSAGRPRGR